MKTQDKINEIMQRINNDCKENTAAYTESQIYESLNEMYEWTKKEIVHKVKSICCRQELTLQVIWSQIMDFCETSEEKEL